MQGKAATINYWAMSCRAFSRRIEYQCLSWLFENLDLREITFAYHPTDRNKPIQDFLASIITTPLSNDIRISRADFSEKCPPLFHQAKATVNA
jgi:predicted enzyme involved in methoxymalonyl-ACP biosynthesis